jgi:cobaltochelatase CobN
MHLLRVESHSLDGLAEAVDLGQTPAEVIVLSFTDGDLSVMASVLDADPDGFPSVRLANLALLRHPYAVDLYFERMLPQARFVLVRLLGGREYWAYGMVELAALARRLDIHLAIVPGDDREDPRLDEASTLPKSALRQIWDYFRAGGPENMRRCLRFMASHIAPGEPVPPCLPVEKLGILASASHAGERDAPLALILLYRAWVLAEDIDPVRALAADLAARGFRVTSVYVTSLKDIAVIPALREFLRARRPDVILNLTSFSARLDDGGSVLDAANAPVLQIALSLMRRAEWAASARGMGPSDLAMNVVLPEFDGRIIAGAMSFKDAAPRSNALQFTRLVHQTEAPNLAYTAALALGWSNLRRTPRADRRIACVLPDYPAKSGRAGYAIGLDTPASVVAIMHRLAEEGFAVLPPGGETDLIDRLATGRAYRGLSLAAYERSLATLPHAFVEQVNAAWGAPDADDAVRDGAFSFRFADAGNMVVALQPDRGRPASRKADYHDPGLPPRHGFIAFYLWLRLERRVHAIIHCGTHGTLEWLPGKATALSDACAPRAVLGAVPLIYPFIVNNPGEAAQAKRRTAAVTIGHLTPPLIQAGAHGAALELEHLFDEYAEAQALDPRRSARLAALILERARDSGLAQEAGVVDDPNPAQALLRLNAWLCDLKDRAISDGLHIFGVPPEASRREAMAASLALAGDAAGADVLVASCAEAEMRGLITALDGTFVAPGPAGAPSRGRRDVLPTGRNLYSVDPRTVPTHMAWDIGRRTADELLTRHVQDHGEWPKRIVLDVWGSAAMRTGGDDLAQAFALLGARPSWDTQSNRVTGFEILPLAVLDRPRVDVTLRISGLFRDVFPAQISLFASLVKAVAALDEAAEDNPLAASVRSDGSDAGHRIFGAGPGAYGVGLAGAIAAGWDADRAELGEAYLRASSHAYGLTAEASSAPAAFRTRVAQADAFLHVQDMAGQDILDADAFAEHEGGFAAAAALLGGQPALYHADTTIPGRSRVRTLREEMAQVVRARATNPRWIAGQMRHGYRGAAELAETIDNFFAFAVLADVTEDRQFDLLFDATLGDDAVRNFLLRVNPDAATSIARRFHAAARRGLWVSRRNITADVLAMLRADPE